MIKTYLATANAAEIFIIGDTAQIKAIYKSLIRAYKKGKSNFYPKFDIPARFVNHKSVYGIQLGEAVMDSKPATFKVGKNLVAYTEVIDFIPTMQVLNSDTCASKLLHDELEELSVGEIWWSAQTEPPAEF